MNAKELRIGNFVYRQSSKMIVNRNDIYQIEVVTKQTQSKYDPIPLTEAWLLKFGFTLVNRANYITIDFDEWELGEFELEDFMYRGSVEKELKYVHELQNLYFALTGEELILNN